MTTRSEIELSQARQASLQDFIIHASGRGRPKGHGGPKGSLRGSHNFGVSDRNYSWNEHQNQAEPILPDFEQPTIQHKAEVAPIFLAYK